MSGNLTTAIQIQFTKACKEGNISDVRRLLTSGVNTEVPDEVICYVLKFIPMYNLLSVK